MKIQKNLFKKQTRKKFVLIDGVPYINGTRVASGFYIS